MTDPTDVRVVYNRVVGSKRILSGASLDEHLTGDAERAPHALHRRLPDYAPTALVEAPALAEQLGVGTVLLKDESERLGLPAFKILGASWAIYRALEGRLGRSLEPWQNVAELARKLEPWQPMILAAATDGNHGRAVAHMAALLGFQARIFVPRGTVAARITAIASEGAQVEVTQT